MAIDFKLPDLGENITSADIGQILVKEGDVIAAEQIVIELETEKAVFELPCPHAGKITKIHVRPGQTVPVGATVLTIETADAKAAAPKPPAPTEPPVAKTAPTAPARKPASEPPRREEVTPPTPRPAPVEPARPTDGAAERITTTAVATTNDVDVFPAPASPTVRRLARELGVDLHQVEGSGGGGRITAEDVQAYVRRLAAGTGASPGAIPLPPLPDFRAWGPVERRPMNKIARAAAANLTTTWQLVPHVTQHEWADITELEAGRKKYSHALGENSPKITMTVLAAKAAVAALKAFPHFNSSVDLPSGEIVLKHYYNIGVAVDTEHGLLVPIVRDADKKSIVELAAEISELAAKARNRKVDLADLRGGTFTISNLGGIGGIGFTPIVNYPEVAILGMSRARWQPSLIGSETKMRLLLPLSLSYDHRVINGADAARFTAKLASLLSDPIELLIEG